MKKILYPIFLLAAIFLFILLYKMKNPSVCFINQCFEVEIARTSQEQENGLMFREKLPQNKGMLFVFDELNIHAFWMKNTKIPLDII